MALKRGFLQGDKISEGITKFRFYAGLFIALIFSFWLYAFLYTSREIFRYFSTTKYYDVWLLTDSEVSFYNLFFAFIAVIFGQSMCFILWFDRPRRPFSKKNYLRGGIVNDQRVLNWYFLFWFAQLSSVVVIYLGFAIKGGFHFFSLLPEYRYLFVLIIIVLFLHTWINIRRIFRKNSLKWMIISLLAILSLSFVLSRIHIIDYKAINKNLLSRNVHHNYKLELPPTTSNTFIHNVLMIGDIFIVLPKGDTKANEPIIVMDGDEVSMEDIQSRIKEKEGSIYTFEWLHAAYKLHIHKEIETAFVNKVKTELIKAGINYIAYATKAHDSLEFLPVYEHSVFMKRLNHPKNEHIYDSILTRIKIARIIDVVQDLNGSISVNSNDIQRAEIKDIFKKLILEDTLRILRYQYDDFIDFSSYYEILEFYRQAVDELMDEEAIRSHGISIDSLAWDQEISIRRKYAMRIREIVREKYRRAEISLENDLGDICMPVPVILDSLAKDTLKGDFNCGGRYALLLLNSGDKKIVYETSGKNYSFQPEIPMINLSFIQGFRPDCYITRSNIDGSDLEYLEDRIMTENVHHQILHKELIKGNIGENIAMIAYRLNSGTIEYYQIEGETRIGEEIVKIHFWYANNFEESMLYDMIGCLRHLRIIEN